MNRTEPPRVDQTSQTRLLLAEDHAPVARLLRELLAAEFEVVATVPDGLALVSAARTLSPDVIVTDVAMPGLDGLEAAAVLLGENRRTRIVFVTVGRDPDLARRAAEIGALGFVTKAEAAETLVPAVRAALRGESYGLPDTES
jgi:DNA-binding NarL/FixJ family response regulator